MFAQGQASSAKTGRLAVVSSRLIFLKKKEKKKRRRKGREKKEARTDMASELDRSGFKS